jgi:hypothetical protein
MFRIDPLTDDGVFDSKFYASEEYTSFYKKVEWYLKTEGFDTTPNEIVIRLFDHLWIIKHNPFK